MTTETAPAKPQDRQPAKDAPFTFKAPGVDKNGKAITKTYRLPKITEDAAEKVPFKFTRRLVMNPDDQMAQMAQAFALLDVVGADPEVIDALESLPTKDAVEIAGDWMGESQRSAD